MRKAIAIVSVVAVLSAVVSAVDGDKAMYVGGTVQGLIEKAEGAIDTKSEASVRFNAGKKGSAVIPYSAITDLEYGQKAAAESLLPSW